AHRSTPVVNLSLSGESNALLSLALGRLMAQDTVLVAAVGNSGPAVPPAFPAAEPGVLGVTAIDIGSAPLDEASRGDAVDFAAPGVRIWTPELGGAGGYHTGTSFAAPYLTAAVAAQLRTSLSASPDEIVARLADAAVDLGEPGKDPVFGWGLVHAASPCDAVNQ
ncbi:MAG: S8 family serine peptidase, partial [Dongiaceae bacterium]